MVNHTVINQHDPALAFPGHNSLIVYVLETKSFGLHCGDCGWSGGSFEGRWAGNQMAKAWAKHQQFIERGGKVEHGNPMSWAAEICLCVRCRLAGQEAAERGREGEDEVIENAIAAEFTAKQIDCLAHLFWAVEKDGGGLSEVADRLFDAKRIAYEASGRSDAGAFPYRVGHRHIHPVTGHEVVVLNREHAAELEALRAAGSGGEGQ